MTTNHKYQSKWVIKLNIVIIWEEVWTSIHNFLLSNETKTAIWEQIHLNFYTQYSYNKWHGKTNTCPLCNKIPQNIYHIILHCDFVNTIWTHMQPVLSKIHSKLIDDAEKALGIINISHAPSIMLRNWITYKMREQILVFERKAHHSPKSVSIDSFKIKFNHSVAFEIKQLMFRYNHENNITKFDKIVAYQGILCEKIQEGEYRVNKIFS